MIQNEAANGRAQSCRPPRTRCEPPEAPTGLERRAFRIGRQNYNFALAEGQTIRQCGIFVGFIISKQCIVAETRTGFRSVQRPILIPWRSEGVLLHTNGREGTEFSTPIDSIASLPIQTSSVALNKNPGNCDSAFCVLQEMASCLFRFISLETMRTVVKRDHFKSNVK